MIEPRKVGPCRYLASAKPRQKKEPVSFFVCQKCGFVLSGWVPNGGSFEISCCGSPMEKQKPQETDVLPVGTELFYDIVGGLNENCIRVFWKGLTPKWLYLETYSGGQYMDTTERRSPAVFALAGEDAYAYCDKDPCIMCSFRCKNGFVLYAFYEELGLVEVPINQIASTPGSKVSKTNKPQHNL